MKERIDKILIDLKLTASRTQAHALIKEGKVFIKGEKVSKPSQKFDPIDIDIEIKEENFYVGRGALKLLSFFEIVPLELEDLIVADVGASTGGFTQVALERGAKKVFAIDVGHDQLHRSLVEDPRVVNLEGVNIKNPYELEEKVDLVVSDLSFISLKLVLKNIYSLLHEEGRAICLFKPQFEVGKKHIGKNGIVKSREAVVECLQEFMDWCEKNEIYAKHIFPSGISGKHGNQEYFIFFDRLLDKSLVQIDEINLV